MASIAYALERIKTNPLEVLDRQAVERVCGECGHEWRERDLDPATTMALFCQQVTWRGTSGGVRARCVAIYRHGGFDSGVLRRAKPAAAGRGAGAFGGSVRGGVAADPPGGAFVERASHVPH